MGADDVLEALYPLLLRHGSPEYIRSDNGPEFVAEALQDWLRRVGIKPIRIYPGSPWENGYNERFNGTLRREVLNAEWFTTTKQAQIVINQWLRQYNHTRPHQALDMRPPVPETLLEKPLISGPETGGSLARGDAGPLVKALESRPRPALNTSCPPVPSIRSAWVVSTSGKSPRSISVRGPNPDDLLGWDRVAPEKKF